MSALVKLEQAARLHRAEDRWLAQSAERLRRAACRQGRIPTSVEPVETTTPTGTER